MRLHFLRVCPGRCQQLRGRRQPQHKGAGHRRQEGPGQEGNDQHRQAKGQSR